MIESARPLLSTSAELVAPEVEIRAFGRLSVTVGGVPAFDRPSPTAEQRFLSLLLAVPGHQLTAHEAGAVLWPRYLERSRVNSFHVVLHHVRRALEPTLRSGAESRYVVRRGTVYRLCVERMDCDVDAFAQLVRGVCWPLDELGARRLEAAIELYRGDFLACESYAQCPPLDELIMRRREQLREAVRTAVEWLGAWYGTVGRTPPGFHLVAARSFS